jgi:hypothetical protein
MSRALFTRSEPQGEGMTKTSDAENIELAIQDLELALQKLAPEANTPERIREIRRHIQDAIDVLEHGY